MTAAVRAPIGRGVTEGLLGAQPTGAVFQKHIRGYTHQAGGGTASASAWPKPMSPSKSSSSPRRISLARAQASASARCDLHKRSQHISLSLSLSLSPSLSLSWSCMKRSVTMARSTLRSSVGYNMDMALPRTASLPCPWRGCPLVHRNSNWPQAPAVATLALERGSGIGVGCRPLSVTRSMVDHARFPSFSRTMVRR